MPLDDPQPYGPQAYGYAQQPEAGGGAADQAKKLVPLLVVLLLVAGGGDFAYDYFVGSIQKVSFSVKNSENEAINNATLRVYANGQANPLATFTGAKTLELKRGDYAYEVAASGYKPMKGVPFAVTPGENNVFVELSKNIDVDLDLELPATLVVGQTLQGKIKLKNKKPAPETIDFVFEGVLAPDTLTILFDPITLGGNSSDEIPLTISVKEGADKKKLGKDKKGSVRVKYTREKKDVVLSLIEFDPSKVTVNVSRLDYGKVNAGDVKEKEVKVSNNNKDFDLKDVRVSLEDIRTQNNPAEVVRQWFTFFPETVDSIGYGSKSAETINLRIEVPSNAANDKINARMQLKTDYWEKSLNVELDVEGKAVALVLEGVADKFVLSKDPTTGKYETETDTIELANKGDVDVQSVSVALDSVKCDSSWASIEGLKSFDSIAPGRKEKDTRLLVTAPKQTPKDFIQTCLLLIRYSDAFNPLERKTIQKTFDIRTE